MVSGEKFNYLVSKEFHHRTSKTSYWTFDCVCGEEYIGRKREVELGITKSCGCMKRKLLRARFPSWQKAEGIASRNALLSSYKKNAKKRNLIFTLTEEEFSSLTKSNCFYCGVEPLQKTNTIKRNGSYIYNGIDRVDNSVGYLLENCVPCCGVCNIAKNDLTQDQFYNWIERVTAHGKKTRYLSHDGFLQSKSLEAISPKD